MGNPMHVRAILADASTAKNGAATENLVRQEPTNVVFVERLRSVNYGSRPLCRLPSSRLTGGGHAMRR